MSPEELRDLLHGLSEADEHLRAYPDAKVAPLLITPLARALVAGVAALLSHPEALAVAASSLTPEMVDELLALDATVRLLYSEAA